MLQIGLGTFGNFLQNLTDPDEVYAPVQWLLEASSNPSCSLLGVGVEPVSEHVERLAPALRELPNSSLVRAAVKGGGDGQSVPVYTITPEKYQSYLDQVAPEKLQDFADAVLFLQNMSCVGQAHPEFWKFSQQLEQEYGVKVEMEPVEAQGLTYGALSHRLHFSGVEVLLIDAEGFDCQILHSMLDHCNREGGKESWPDVIQFETMGHSDKIDGCGSEDAILDCLRRAGYLLAASGSDTQVVREEAIKTESRVARWVDTFHCERCGVQGREGMPFSVCSGYGTTCRECDSLYWAFGIAVWDEWEALPGELRLMGIATTGGFVWGVTKEGTLFKHNGEDWQGHGGGYLQQISMLQGRADTHPEMFGVDRVGQVWHLHRARWDVLPPAPTGGPILKRVAATRCGVWCLDEDHAIHVYEPAQRKWTCLYGRLTEISVSADGAHVWGVNAFSEVYYRAGGSGKWEQMSGRLDWISVSSDGCHVWGVQDSYVFYRPGKAGDWSRVPGRLTQVCTCDSGRRVWGLDAKGYVWTFGV